jgi:hypothetical protein
MPAVLMDVRALAVPVEDRDDLGGAVDRPERVRRHGGELGGFPGFDGDLAVTERQAHPSFEHEEPVVPGVHPLLRCLAGRLESHLDGDR